MHKTFSFNVVVSFFIESKRMKQQHVMHKMYVMYVKYVKEIKKEK